MHNIITITIRQNESNDYCHFDNTVATATLINQSIRDKLNAYELTKNDGKDSLLLLCMKGNIDKTIIRYKVYDYSGEYTNIVLNFINKWTDSYKITTEVHYDNQ